MKSTTPFAGLEPAAFWEYFSQLCAIPHGSHNCQAIGRYLADFAQSHGLRHIRDSANNVVIFAPGTPGYEDHPPVILQGHMDMVCQKDTDCQKDLSVDPIEPVVEGDKVYAPGTTLGADDGIAVALFLAILADKTIAHPPLEVVFTADEETGLEGATALDMSVLQGRRMINVDTFKEGVFFAGSAGGATVTLEKTVTREPVRGPRVRICVSGFRGGHSSAAVGAAFANADLVMAQILDQLNCRLVAFQGGTAPNAVPRECVCEVIDATESDVRAVCEQVFENIKRVTQERQAAYSIECLPEDTVNALSRESTRQVTRLMCQLPNGVLEQGTQLPITSLSLGIARLTDRLHLCTYVRSNINASRDRVLQTLGNLAGKWDCDYRADGVYSAWELVEDSKLRKIMAGFFCEKYGNPPEIRTVHAGLEGGVFSEKLPGLDCVSTGPNAYEVHTTREWMQPSSLARFWEYLKEVLKAL